MFTPRAQFPQPPGPRSPGMARRRIFRRCSRRFARRGLRLERMHQNRCPFQAPMRFIRDKIFFPSRCVLLIRDRLFSSRALPWSPPKSWRRCPISSCWRVPGRSVRNCSSPPRNLHRCGQRLPHLCMLQMTPRLKFQRWKSSLAPFKSPRLPKPRQSRYCQ